MEAVDRSPRRAEPRALYEKKVRDVSLFDPANHRQNPLPGQSAEFLRAENSYSTPKGADRIVCPGKDRIGAVHDRICSCANRLCGILDIREEWLETIEKAGPVVTSIGVRSSRRVLPGRVAVDRIIGLI